MLLPTLACLVFSICTAINIGALRVNPSPEEEHRPQPQPQPNQETNPPIPEPDTPKAGSSQGMSSQDLTAKAVKSVITHIAFARKPRVIGTQIVGERVTGTRREEVPYPSRHSVIRPSRGFDDIHRRLPSERTLPSVIQFARLASGEAMVQSYEEDLAQKEPIVEPLYDDTLPVVYLLLDQSGSMIEKENRWKKPLWKGIAHGLIDQAIEKKARFIMRGFTIRVTPKQVVDTPEEAEIAHRKVDRIVPNGGTDIQHAINCALKDCEELELENADIMILTDGEDEKIDVAKLRKTLDAANIRLHAILLGVQNKALRSAADVYQEISKGPKVHEAIHRT